MAHTIYCDYETFYSSDYSLGLMTTREYIYDHRFEVIGASIAIDDEEPKWYDAEVIPFKLAQVRWDEAVFVAHNTLFDGAITQWKYGFKPKLWADTMGMAQALLGASIGSVALKNVSAKLNGRVKDTAALLNMKGRRSQDIDKSSPEWKRYTDYADDDTWNCRHAYKILRPLFPDKEMIIIDTLLRMYFDGRIELDADLIGDSLAQVRAEAATALARAGISNVSDLRSRDTFAGMLKSLGVTPPMKVSPSTGKQTYAFAKNDVDFLKLKEHDNPRVVALVDAKLNASSSIEETRAKRFANLAALDGSVLNIPLRYSAAHTHRFGGCLTTDNYVTVQGKGEVRIDRVADNDLVWDGVAFVEHDGVVFQGIKEVIEHDEVVGTPCHPVLTRDGRGYISLAEAKATGSYIRAGSVPGTARVNPVVRRDNHADAKSAGDLLTMRRGKENKIYRHDKVGAGLVPELCVTGTYGRCSSPYARDGSRGGDRTRAEFARAPRADRRAIQDTAQVGSRSIAAVQQSAKHWMEKLRRSQDCLQVLEPVDGGEVCGTDARAATVSGTQLGPDRQRGALRAGEFTLGDEAGTERQSERLSWMAPTFDIINCGPRSRFVANGKIVHNSDNLNLQNLGRKSPLRMAMKAPPGYKMVVVDASQIEARLLSWLAGCTALVSAFSNKEDVYSTFASKVFGFEVNKQDHPSERFIGKTGVLGLGYGTGWAKLQWSLLTSPYYDGAAGDDFCQNMVETYRTSYSEIPAFWKRCDGFLATMAAGDTAEWGPLKFKNQQVLLPSGLPIVYPQLHWESGEEWGDRGFVYWSHRYRSWKKIYGAALTENLTQALARIIITDAMIYMRLTDPDYFCALQCHDELVYIVPDHKAEKCYSDLMKFMCTIPKWANAELPLDAEGAIATRYGEAK